MPKLPLASFRSTASRPGVGLNLTQTPIGFVSFHGQSARCRAQSYPDPDWLRFVRRPVGPVSGSILLRPPMASFRSTASRPGIGLNLTQTPIGFVSMSGEWKAPSVEHSLRRNRIGAQDRRRIEKEQESARVSMVLLSLRNDVLFRVHRRGSCSSGTRAPTGERPPFLFFQPPDRGRKCRGPR